MATMAAEVLNSMTLRVPSLCFQQDVAPDAADARQLQLARDNVAKYLPPHLDAKKFRQSLFVHKDLRGCNHVYLRDDSLAKLPLELRYTGPFQVLKKGWNNNTFTIRIGDKQEVVSLGRVKAATLVS